jgi:hypothetical protein
MNAHKEFMRTLRPLYGEANAGRGQAAAARARALGREYSPRFHQAHDAARAIRVPQSATRAHEYLMRWLQALVSACDTLPNAPQDGKDTSYLRDCHDFVDDARYAAKALSELRTRLREALGRAPGTEHVVTPPTSGTPGAS